MLEFLLSFIKNNIILIFFIIEFFAIASVYSKRIKLFFFTIFGLIAVYLVLLCLYHMGYGIECLYIWSSKYILILCSQINCFGMLLTNHSFLSSPFIEKISDTFFAENFLFLLGAILLIIVYSISIKATRFKILNIKSEKSFKKEVELNKFSNFYNTINKKQSKPILNSVLRC